LEPMKAKLRVDQIKTIIIYCICSDDKPKP
jgi:hypothetical protein